MYARNVAGKTLTFRLKPEVLKGNLLFEDLETGSLWSQLAQEAVKGPLKGTRLRTLPAAQTTWKQWKKMHSDTLVLSPRLGLAKESYEYGPIWTPSGEFVRGMRPRELVLGLDQGSVGKAYPFKELKKAGGKIQDEIRGQAVSITYDATSESAVARNENGELVPAVTVYWKNWVEFHGQTEVYEARKRSLRGRLETVDLETKRLRIIDHKGSQPHTFTVGAKTKFSGDRKALGKNRISWTDLTADLLVEVKFIEGVEEALEVKVVGKGP